MRNLKCQKFMIKGTVELNSPNNKKQIIENSISNACLKGWEFRNLVFAIYPSLL